MHPTLDLIFFDLPVYTALVMLGAASGLCATFAFLRAHYARAARLSEFLDGALIVFAASWIGARAYHVALNWDYYATRQNEIAQIGLGGLAMRGALIAGFLALAVYARGRGLRFSRIADATTLGLCLGQAMGWGGALAWGANYGVISDSPIAVDLPDAYGLFAPRFPLQAAEIGLFACLFVGLLILAFRKPSAGSLFLLYVLLTSAAQFALGFQRGDETLFVGALRFDQVVDAALVLLAGGGWLWRRGFSRNRTNVALPI